MWLRSQQTGSITDIYTTLMAILLNPSTERPPDTASPLSTLGRTEVHICGVTCCGSCPQYGYGHGLSKLAVLRAGNKSIPEPRITCRLSRTKHGRQAWLDKTAVMTAQGSKAPWVHTDEGDDDMPAHVKSSMFGASVSVPISNGRLNLGTWQVR